MTRYGKNRALARAIGGALVAVTMLISAGCGDIRGHEEFQKEVMGKSEADVTKVVGKPAAVDSSNPARITWTYNTVTYDVENQNKRDARTLVIFAPGPEGKLKVSEIKYER